MYRSGDSTSEDSEYYGQVYEPPPRYELDSIDNVPERAFNHHVIMVSLYGPGIVSSLSSVI
jgi:hypothetical protein